MLITDSEQSFNIIIIGTVFLFVVLLQVSIFKKNMKNMWNNILNIITEHTDIVFLVIIILGILTLYYKNIIIDNTKYYIGKLISSMYGDVKENFELNILDDSILKKQLDINENSAKNILDQYHQTQVTEISTIIKPSDNNNKYLRCKKAFELLYLNLKSVSSSINIIAAEKGLLEFTNDKDMIKNLMLYTQDKYIKNIFNETYSSLFDKINSNDEKFINNNDMSLKLDYTRRYISDIIDSEINEFKTNFLNNGGFNKIKNKLLQIKSSTDFVETSEEDNLNILDALDYNTTPEIRDLYQKFKPYTQKLKNLGFKHDYFYSYSNISAKLEEYNITLDNESDNVTNLTNLMNKCDKEIETLKLIEVKNEAQANKLNKLKTIKDKITKTLDIFDVFMKNNRNEKINNMKISKFIEKMFFGNDTSYKLNIIAPELFLTDAEIEQKLQKLETIRNSSSVSSNVPNTTDQQIGTGTIENDLNLPEGYFKLGYIDKSNNNKTVFLTLTNNARTTVSTNNPVSLSVALSNPGGDDFKEQLWYTDKLGRIFSVKNNFCLTVEPKSSDSLLPKINDLIFATRASKEELSLQRFEFNDEFTTLKLLQSYMNNTSNELYLSVSQDELVRLDKFDNKENQVNWFIELVGGVQVQKSIFPTTGLTRNDTRQVLVIDNNNLPAYSKFTYSFWIWVKENSSQDIGRRPIFIKGNVVDNNLDINERYQNMGQNDTEYEEENINKLYYRSPGVFIESGVELFDMSVILSTNFKLNETFKIVNKESTKLNMWNHISLILDNKELKIYVNGNLDSTHNLMGTPFNNEYPLYITPGGGFAGKLHYMRYYNYARTDDEVKKDLSETAPPDLVVSNIPVEEYISKPEQYKPTENLNDPNSSTLHSSFGWLPNISSLFKIKSVRRNIYLQANFESLDGSLNDYYNVNKILLQGHGNKNAYVKQFKVMYFDYYDNDWRYYNNGEILAGNVNNFDIKEIPVNILTNKIRILPQNWNLDSSGTHLLGLRVGFNGVDKKPNRCDKKISMCKVDQMMKDREKSFTQLSRQMDASVDRENLHEVEHNRLRNRIDRIQLELNKSRMKTLLYKHGKCSEASERVLPDTTPATSSVNNESNCSISNFDIRDHPDFLRYLNNVKMERLCKHLMNISPNKYDSLESCINIMIDKIEKHKKNK